MVKFEYNKKATILKNGHKIETTTIHAPNKQELIPYDYLTKVIEKLAVTGVDVKKLRIFGSNRISAITIKSEGENYDPDYLKNKPEIEANKYDGFHTICLVWIK